MSYAVTKVLDKLPPYQGRKRLINRRQHTSDIITAILQLHPRMMAHYDAIAMDHWRGSPEETARELFYFLRQNVPYKEEKQSTQTVKTPAAILEERYDFGNDCKHYASYIVGVGEALRRLGYPVKCFYRFASYKKGNRSPGHVFAVFVVNGKEIWIDPVPQIAGFDSRTIVPAYKIDKMPPMSRNGGRIGSLYEISGLPLSNEQTLGRMPTEVTLGNCRGHWMDHGRQQPKHREAMPAWVRYIQQGGAPPRPIAYTRTGNPIYSNLPEGMGKAHKKKHHGLKIKVPKIQPGKLLKAVAGAPSRNAFLLLVKLNTFHLATNMWKKAAHDKSSAAWQKLASKWRSLGGKPEKLYGEIVRGVKTYNKLHKAKKHIAVSGFDDLLASQGYVAPEIIEGPQLEETEADQRMPDYIGSPYHDGMYTQHIYDHVGDNAAYLVRRIDGIGVVQAAAGAAIIAAAAPIIAALAGLLKSLGINTKKAEETSEESVKQLAKDHNENAEGSEGENGEVTHPDGTVTKVTHNADGSQSIEVVKQPGTPETQDPNGGQGDETTITKTKTKTITHSSDGDGGDGGGILDTVKNFMAGHKAGLITTGAGAVMIGIGMSMNPGKRDKALRIVKPVLTFGGIAAAGFGIYKMFQK